MQTEPKVCKALPARPLGVCFSLRASGNPEKTYLQGRSHMSRPRFRNWDGQEENNVFRARSKTVIKEKKQMVEPQMSNGSSLFVRDREPEYSHCRKPHFTPAMGAEGSRGWGKRTA